MNDQKKEECNSGCRLTKRLLGRILVDGEFISAHDLAGYLLVFDGANGHLRPFNDIQVKGLENDVQISPGGGWIPQPYARGAVTMELSYRFILSKDVQPGTYAWPLTVSVRPA